MTRIIAGKWGGRRLETPPGEGTRPTTDRVRESLFASLTSHFGSFESLRVLDLFAGSGALGFESLSRGASGCQFVEHDRRAATTIERNARALAAVGISLHRMSALRFITEIPAHPCDIAFLDPPYTMPTIEVGQVLDSLARFGWLNRDAVVVVERSSRAIFAWPNTYVPLRDKRYGETQLWYGQEYDESDVSGVV